MIFCNKITHLTTNKWGESLKKARSAILTLIINNPKNRSYGIDTISNGITSADNSSSYT